MQEFVLVSASVSTPRPPTTERVVALNRGPWVARAGRSEELADPGDATVLDVRPFADHAAGHVPGSISVPVYGGVVRRRRPASCSFPASASCCTRATREEALEAACELWAVGILELAGYVLHPDVSETLATVDPDELRALLEQPGRAGRRRARGDRARRGLHPGLDATSPTGCCARSAPARSSEIGRS